MKKSAIKGIVTIIMGIAVTLKSYLLPDASIGSPMAPKMFPLGLGVIMVLLGVILTIQEMRKAKEVDDNKDKVKDDTNKMIVMTCFTCILYALLFNRIGYLMSTIIFLNMMLLLFNGRKKWKTNTVVAFAFSIFIYVVFTKFLGVSLPPISFLDV